jgi:hypothetical protein
MSKIQMNSNKLHLYYRQKGILPTHARFASNEDLDKYQAFRENLFCNKLHIPLQMFKGVKLIEFGPDSGENALIFAKWGASLTLVEPNPNAWPKISGYFEKFDLKDKLNSLVKTDLEGFQTTEKFQFIDAEAGIFTIKPGSVWIELFDKILEENGLFVISYMEIYGSLLELFLKLIYVRARGVLGGGSNNIAWRLFQAKWDSIAHTRSFDQWVTDVLDNPFIRLNYFLSAGALCLQLLKSGFYLYSSWPNYIDTMDVYWHKKEFSPEDKLANNLAFISRSNLSFTFGKKLFFASESLQDVEAINSLLWEIVSLVDKSIDVFDRSSIEKCNDLLGRVKYFILNKPIIVNSCRDKQEALQLTESVSRILKLLIAGDIDSLISFCNSDYVFIKSWGLPTHFAVFKKLII